MPRPPQVRHHLYSKKWEARVAAGEAIGLFAEHFVHPTAADLRAAAGAAGAPAAAPGAAGGEEEDGSLSFATFSLARVLEAGRPLAASAGAEFDAAQDDEALPPAERLKRQRAQLKQRLGACFRRPSLPLPQPGCASIASAPCGAAAKCALAEPPPALPPPRYRRPEGRAGDSV